MGDSWAEQLGFEEDFALTMDRTKQSYAPLRIFMGEHYRELPTVPDDIVRANHGREVEWFALSCAIEELGGKCAWMGIGRRYRELLQERRRYQWADNLHEVYCERMLVVEMTASFIVDKWPAWEIVGDYLEDAGSSLCELARQVLPFCYDRHRECDVYPRLAKLPVMDGWFLRKVDAGAGGLIDSIDRLRGLQHYDLRIDLQKPIVPTTTHRPIKFYEHQPSGRLHLH